MMRFTFLVAAAMITMLSLYLIGGISRDCAGFTDGFEDGSIADGSPVIWVPLRDRSGRDLRHNER